MGTIVDMSMSLDGFVAGPSPSLEQPLGEGGDRLHEWAVGLEAFRERHGRDGGEASADSERIRKTFDSIGAFVMGRRMYSGARARGTPTPRPTAGGATTRRSGRRSSC
jgi:dihydrofolate reductase